MKRTIGKVGLSSLVVTLPHKYVKRYGLIKGDEVTVIEAGRHLIIQAVASGQDDKKITLDISGLDSTLVWRYVLGAYKQGYSEIAVRFDSQRIPARGRLERQGISAINISDLVREISGLLVGMEIISNSTGQIVLREIARAKPDELLSTYRRMIYLLKLMAEEVSELSGAKQGKAGEILESLRQNDITVNKLTSYAERIISMNPGEASYPFSLLEQMGDILKALPSGDRSMNLPHVMDNVAGCLDILARQQPSRKEIMGFFEGIVRIPEGSGRCVQLRDNLRELGQVLIEASYHDSADRF